MRKLFLLLSLCLTAPAFGMQRPAAKFRQLVPVMIQRATYSGPRHVPLEEVEKDREEVRGEISESNQPQLWKIEYFGKKAEMVKLREQVAEIEKEVMSRDWHKDCCEQDWMGLKDHLLRGRNKPEELEALKQLVVAGEAWTNEIAERKAAEKQKEKTEALRALDALHKETEKHSKVLAVGMKQSAAERDVLRAIEIFLHGSPKDISTLRAAIEKVEASSKREQEVIQGFEDALKKAKEALKCLEAHTSDRSKNSSKKD